jgi:YaiO family outer membrane protein
MSRKASTALRLTVTLAGCVIVHAAPASAQPSPWAADVTSERASVDIYGFSSIWSTERVQSMWSQPEVGGWLIAAERQQRGGLVDVSLSTLGYKQVGKWTLLGAAAATPDSQFLFRESLEAELSRRVVGTIVASGRYRYLDFRSVDVHQAQPALTWYHARGEVEGRAFVTRNMSVPRTTAAALIRSSYAFTPRLRLAGGVAVGDRIFDIASLPFGTARSRVGFGNVRVGLTTHDFIDVGATAAHEQPAFTYRSFSLGYRRVF